MTAFVLVHGAWWSGDWLWQGVAAPLRAQGHRVFTPALTGLGPRSHLASPGLNLSTHIADVVQLIKWEELSDIVLVGHSYGGMVISGALEEVPPGTIRSVVYLDAFVPKNGESLIDLASNANEALGNADPVPPPPFFAEQGTELAAILKRRGTPQARACFFDKLSLTGARDQIPTKTYVWATGSPVFRRFYDELQSDPGWRTLTIDCGHMTMLERPEETTEIIARAQG